MAIQQKSFFVSVVLVLMGFYFNLRSNGVQCDQVTDIIQNLGYHNEVHDIATEDGYILRLHRIITKSKGKLYGSVLLLHGLGQTSHCFIFPYKPDALAFTLADSGYDVWLGNVRGSTFSQRHNYLKLDSSAYWNFTFHQMALFDLPAKIDYILDVTNQKSLNYIGFSQGGTVVISMLSMLPQYNRKIKKAFLIAPGVFLQNNSTNLFWINSHLMALKYYSLGHRTKYPAWLLLNTLCNLELGYCPNTAFGVLGYSKFENGFDFFNYLTNFIGMKQNTHVAQLSKTNKFQMFDYGIDNIRIYGQKIPPEYNLHNFKVPTYLYHGDSDTIVPPNGIIQLYRSLPNIRKLKWIRGYNHVDMLYAKNAKNEIFSDILASLEQRLF